MASFNGWQVGLLRSIGAPITRENLRFLNAWQAAEGGSAAFNPLNTTQPAPGASKYNSVGVRNFRGAQQGVLATAQTLLNGHYGPIVQLLRSGRATAAQLGTAVAHSPWGTGSGVLRVLGSGPAAVPGGAERAAQSRTGAIQTGLSDRALRSMAAAQMLDQSLATAQGRPTDSSGLMALAVARRQFQAAQDTYGDRAQGSLVVPHGKGGGGSINELFYDPLGGIKYGRQIGAIGHHGDHVHVSLSSLQAQQRALAQARAMGLHVGEESDRDVHPVHTGGSFHYRHYNNKSPLRQAADISGSPSAMAAYYRWVAANFR